jgi:ribosome biogenesis GTPase / thiamine phosphate phosphatase
MPRMDLLALGYAPFADTFSDGARPGDEPGRVFSQHYGGLFVVTAEGEKLARIPGRVRRDAARGIAELPVVGDWVALRSDAMIHRVLPRRSVLARRAAGAVENAPRQVIAANVDTVFITTSFGPDLSPRRLERYLALVWDGGAEPVVVVTKADLIADVDAALAPLAPVVAGARVIATSVVTGTGLAEIDAYLQPSKTVALLGSSGVGKSTLVNRWLGRDTQKLQEVRGDGTGRHTTTHRELFVLANGALVVDTPGMREVGLVDEAAGVDTAFPEIDELAEQCRFRDCRHEAEPGCAILAALAAGTLPAERFESFRKLQRELGASRAAAKSHVSAKALRALYKLRGDDS